MHPSEILRRWREGLISNGEALLYLTETDVSVVEGIEAIRTLAKEMIELETAQAESRLPTTLRK